MHEAKKYKKMVFYVEACESGSMFKVYLVSIHKIIPIHPILTGSAS